MKHRKCLCECNIIVYNWIINITNALICNQQLIAHFADLHCTVVCIFIICYACKSSFSVKSMCWS